MKKLIAILSIIVLLFSCSINNTETRNSPKNILNNNVTEMIENMKNIHLKCEGKSIHYRGSAERTTISIWDSKYPKEDVDFAIEELKPSLLTDEQIRREQLGYAILNMSKREIK
jgi:hypothetical protein